MKSKEEEVKKIIEAIEDKGLTAYEIAVHTNLTEHGIQKIINGTSKNPHNKTILQLRNFLDNYGIVRDENIDSLKLNEPEEDYIPEYNGITDDLVANYIIDNEESLRTNKIFKMWLRGIQADAKSEAIMEFMQKKKEA